MYQITTTTIKQEWTNLKVIQLPIIFQIIIGQMKGNLQQEIIQIYNSCQGLKLILYLEEFNHTEIDECLCVWSIINKTLQIPTTYKINLNYFSIIYLIIYLYQNQMFTPSKENCKQVFNSPSRINGQIARLSIQEAKSDLKQNNNFLPSSQTFSHFIHLDHNLHASQVNDKQNNYSEFEVITKPNASHIINSPISLRSSINSKSTITSEQYLKQNFIDTIKRSPSKCDDQVQSSYVVELNDRVNKLEKIIDEKNDLIDLHQQRFTQLKQKYDQVKDELQVQENWRQHNFSSKSFIN
ncbi:hypothetical protein pb186bvf_006100 [Paramecium bursaria]